MKQTDSLHIKLPEGLRGRLRAIADEDGRTLSSQAVMMIKWGVERREEASKTAKSAGTGAFDWDDSKLD